MIERVLAAIVLVACLLLLLRLAIGTRRRLRLDAALRRARTRVRRAASGMRHWQTSRRDAERARKLTDELIQRARARSEPGGKTPPPRTFRKPPRDKMH